MPTSRSVELPAPAGDSAASPAREAEAPKSPDIGRSSNGQSVSPQPLVDSIIPPGEGMSDQNHSTRRCAHQHPDGNFCGRWPSAGSHFCYLHRRANGEPAAAGHPLMRLSSPADLFDVIREALHAARLGRIQPGQAYAVGYLAHLWLRAYRELSCADREAALQGDCDYLPDLASHDGESVASVAATPVEPLPPTPDSPVLDALEEKREKQMARKPSLFSFRDPNPPPELKGLEKRLMARILQEMSKPSPANGGTK